MGRLFRKSFLLHREQEEKINLVVPIRNAAIFWPFLFSCSFFLFAITSWLFLSELPVEVEANGMVLPLGGVREINAFSEGVVISRPHTNQQVIEAGDVLLELSPLGADENFLQARRSYLENRKALGRRADNAKAMHARAFKKIQLQISAIEQSRSGLLGLKSTLIQAAETFSDSQQQSLAEQEQTLMKLRNAYQDFLGDLDRLKENYLVNRQEYLSGLQQHSTTLQSLSELSLRSPKSSLDQQRLKKDIFDLQSLIVEQDIQLTELNNQLAEANEKLLMEQDRLQLEELQFRQTLLQNERDLWRGSTVIAPYTGELLALNKSIGQGVGRGESVALLGMLDQSVQQMLVISPRAVTGYMRFSYLSRQQDLKLNLNPQQFVFDIQRMVAQLMEVERHRVKVQQKNDRYIIALHDFPQRIKQLQLVDFDLQDIESAPVFSSLQIIGDQWHSSELVNIALIASDQAKRIAPGNEVLVKPDYVTNLAGSQLQASVRQMGKLITTSIEAEALIGTSELAQKIAGDKAGVAIIIDLKKDSEGRYLWNGVPPDIPLAIGSTTKSKIQVDKVPPIEVIFPLVARFFKE